DPLFENAASVTADGKAIFFLSPRQNGWAWRMDADGSNLRDAGLPKGAGKPVVSPDMQWIYFTSFAKPTRQTFRMPIAGGTPEALTAHWDALGVKDDGVFYHPTVQIIGLSPDGRQGLGYYADPDKRGWRIGIFPIGGGQPTRLDILDYQTTWLPDQT